MTAKFDQSHYDALARALVKARTALAEQYLQLPEDDWDVANSHNSASAAINLVEMYLMQALARDGDGKFNADDFEKAAQPSVA